MPDRHHALFVHIPKAAGTSIVRSLFGCEGGRHMTLRHYSLISSAQELKDAFKFTFVRNPWDRLYSAFSYLKGGGRGQADQLWAEQHLTRVPDFRAFVLDWLPGVDLESSYTHLVPQYHFLRIRGDTPHRSTSSDGSRRSPTTTRRSEPASAPASPWPTLIRRPGRTITATTTTPTT
ncbi:sulfotransferase family 2 domain-containing protein [Tautonia rosea]|uniref:sulfotransferase family 2 domain-containing protein n=1 Tax=Tautonia rosea TaxID=2728037 RepID=UPI00147311EC|nr:sulfotransferase family 2 domain-containing protein [Tautonia rosea]